jgi:AMP-polyphosphate phosphotransferase
MLAELDLGARVGKDEYREKTKALELELGALQRKARELALPVIVVFEGWDAAGKGTLINRLMLTLDARGFTVHPIGAPTEDERLRPFLWRFWLRTPPRGRIAIFDRSWYGRVLVERVEGHVPKGAWRRSYDEIVAFEREIADDGCCFVKLFLHIDRDEQKARFKKLESRRATAWKVTANEWRQHRHYDEYAEAVEDVLARTSTEWAPWTVVAANHGRTATLQVFTAVASALRASIAREEARRAAPKPAVSSSGEGAVRHPGILSTINPTVSLDREAYEVQLERLQKRLHELEHEIYLRRLGVVVAYEGWDAAGKGGNIRRLVQGLDPRGFEVFPVAAPNDVEKAHHYLWRFWRDVPKAGHIAIFDRSWYGRVMVERIEGFCSTEEWQRAYGEINDMERQWTDFGIVLVKFWLHIDPAVQLARFEERKDSPFKQWKITDEDWRNREKWDRYREAVDDMLGATSPPNAPWTIVESDNKLHARIKALRTVVGRIEERME